MFGADVAMIETLSLFGGVCKNALTFVRKRQVDRCRNFLTNRRSTFDFLANALNRRMISQETVGQILILADQTQQQRSEERRVGKECRCGWATDHERKK